MFAREICFSVNLRWPRLDEPIENVLKWWDTPSKTLWKEWEICTKKKKKRSEKEEFYVDLYTGSLVTRGALFFALECKPRKVQITKQIRPGHFLTEL